MGKPVVSVRSPEMEKFSDVIYISDNYEEFVDNIENALNNNTDISSKKAVIPVKPHPFKRNPYKKPDNEELMESYNREESTMEGSVRFENKDKK